MRFLAFATDYDGTLAHHGKVSLASVTALKNLAATGRKLILVTGRELSELLEVFPELELFHRVVAENGALLYRPDTRESRLLAPKPPAAFVRELIRRKVEPLSVGGSIVATVHPNENIVLEVIRDLGLELHVIFNKGAVMVLPTGLNKATGLKLALQDLCLSLHNVVAVGDAENDHALLEAAELGVAVANALPGLKDNADHVTRGINGKGIAELIEGLLADDLAGLSAVQRRRSIVLGTAIETEKERRLPAFGPTVLIAGTSGSGKSTLASALLEQLVSLDYQCCIVDPEGDYETFPGVISLGDPTRAPAVTEVIAALERPPTSVAVNLLGVKFEDRPGYFLELLAHLQELRTRTGRPHWIFVDETHHVLPVDRPIAPAAAGKSHSIIYVTVEPKTVNTEVLGTVDVVAALGDKPAASLQQFCGALEIGIPAIRNVALEPGQALLWFRDPQEPPFVVQAPPNKTARRRHLRKYAHGELSADDSFYFRGPKDALNLRAQNLQIFTQIADGVDERTWRYHLQRGEYSHWIRGSIKDSVLADEIAAIEAAQGLSAEESRGRVKAAIEHHYILPASAAKP